MGEVPDSDQVDGFDVFKLDCVSGVTNRTSTEDGNGAPANDDNQSLSQFDRAFNDGDTIDLTPPDLEWGDVHPFEGSFNYRNVLHGVASGNYTAFDDSSNSCTAFGTVTLGY